METGLGLPECALSGYDGRVKEAGLEAAEPSVGGMPPPSNLAFMPDAQGLQCCHQELLASQQGLCWRSMVDVGQLDEGHGQCPRSSSHSSS